MHDTIGRKTTGMELSTNWIKSAKRRSDPFPKRRPDVVRTSTYAAICTTKGRLGAHPQQNVLGTYHKTIIRIGIICKKIPCYSYGFICTPPLARGVLLKIKIFWGYVKTFFNSPGCEKLWNLDWSMWISFHQLLNHFSRLR